MRKSHRGRMRKERRQQKAVLKFGRKAAPTHKLLAGRTGSVHIKKTKPKAEQSNSRAKATIPPPCRCSHLTICRYHLEQEMGVGMITRQWSDERLERLKEALKATKEKP